MSTEDHELLREYAQRRCEKAFTELVRRHVDMVYSTALRSVREPHLARDIVQSVFIFLARKPESVREPRLLAGWLYRTTRFNAAGTLRKEGRRREREATAMQLNMVEPDSPSSWQSLVPHLDEAMENLSPTDQSAIALRFFEGKSLHAVGQSLGISDDAAQKRVSRAVEALRSQFTRKGIAVTSAALLSVLGSQTSTAAPTGLAASVATASLATAAVAGSGGIGSLISTIFMSKAKMALVAAVIAGAVAIPIMKLRRENARLRQVIVTLRWEKQAMTQNQNGNSALATTRGKQEVAAKVETTGAPNRSMAELVNETAASLAKSRGEDKWAIGAKWAKFLLQIPNDQIDQALLEISKLPAGEIRTGMNMTVFHMWTEVNPRAALAFATVNFKGQELSQSVNDALAKWARQEPEAAFAAWREQSSDPSKRMVWGGMDETIVTALFEGMSKQNLQNAMRSLENLDREHFGNALAGVAGSAAGTEEGRKFFLQELERVTDPVVKERALQRFMIQWASRHDLASAMAWVESLPQQERGTFAREVGHAYVRSNPKAGAEWWMAQVANQKDRSDAIFNIAQTWATKDINAAGEWLGRQGDGPETDSARYAYAVQVVYREPETAMKWVQSISKPDYRKSSMLQIWREWRRLDDAAAERFLAQSGWSKDLVEEARIQ